MKRIIGMLIGVGYLGIVSYTFRVSRAGWEAGHPDIGFWWAVISGFLTIAALAAFIGTWIHTQPQQH